jgi:hypothetical protein
MGGDLPPGLATTRLATPICELMECAGRRNLDTALRVVERFPKSLKVSRHDWFAC